MEEQKIKNGHKNPELEKNSYQDFFKGIIIETI